MLNRLFLTLIFTSLFTQEIQAIEVPVPKSLVPFRTAEKAETALQEAISKALILAKEQRASLLTKAGLVDDKESLQKLVLNFRSDRWNTIRALGDTIQRAQSLIEIKINKSLLVALGEDLPQEFFSAINSNPKLKQHSRLTTFSNGWKAFFGNALWGGIGIWVSIDSGWWKDLNIFNALVWSVFFGKSAYYFIGGGLKMLFSPLSVPQLQYNFSNDHVYDSAQRVLNHLEGFGATITIVDDAPTKESTTESKPITLTREQASAYLNGLIPLVDSLRSQNLSGASLLAFQQLEKTSQKLTAELESAWQPSNQNKFLTEARFAKRKALTAGVDALKVGIICDAIPELKNVIPELLIKVLPDLELQELRLLIARYPNATIEIGNPKVEINDPGSIDSPGIATITLTATVSAGSSDAKRIEITFTTETKSSDQDAVIAEGLKGEWKNAFDVLNGTATTQLKEWMQDIETALKQLSGNPLSIKKPCGPTLEKLGHGTHQPRQAE